MSSDASKEELIKALDAAYEMDLTNRMMDWQGKFKVAPQHEKGVSAWAKLLRLGKIQPKDALWAMKEGKDGKKREWLAARITLGSEVFYFNLRCGEDSDSLQELADKAMEKAEKE